MIKSKGITEIDSNEDLKVKTSTNFSSFLQLDEDAEDIHDIEVNPFAIKSDYNTNEDYNMTKHQNESSTKPIFSNNDNIIQLISSLDENYDGRKEFQDVNPFAIKEDYPDIEGRQGGVDTTPDSTKKPETEIQLIKLQMDLEKRVQELEHREKTLLHKEKQLNQSTQYPPMKNWPKFPKWIPFSPCFHQNISEDIPTIYQKVVKKTYYSWLFYITLLTCNVLVGLIDLFVGLGTDEEQNKGKEFGLAILYEFIFIPTSYVCWFRVLYKACKNDSSAWFMTFFFMSFCQILLNFICFVGINGSGFFGLINGILHFTCDTCVGKNYFVGTCMVLLGVAFACCGIFQCYSAIKINKLHTKTETKTSNEDKKSKKMDRK